MKLTIITFLFACTITNCSNKIAANVATKPPSKLPVCIQKHINEIKKQPVWNPPAEVYEYKYYNKTVYLLSADCCDFFTTAVDTACKPICAPSGGITGKGDGKCPDFNETAKLVKLVWKDPRATGK